MQKQKIKQSHKLFVRDEMKRVGGQPGFISVEKERKKKLRRNMNMNKKKRTKNQNVSFFSLYIFRKAECFHLNITMCS